MAPNYPLTLEKTHNFEEEFALIEGLTLRIKDVLP